MKSWLHEISKSYISTKKPVRRDLKEHYVQLSEEQRFELLSENFLVYLDEQLKNAYGIGVNDLNEEQLNELLGGLAALAGSAVGGIARGAKAVAGAVAKPFKAGLDIYASGEAERAKGAAERAEAIKGASTLGGKLKATAQLGKGMVSAFKVGMGMKKPAEAVTDTSTIETNANSANTENGEEKEATPVAAVQRLPKKPAENENAKKKEEIKTARKKMQQKRRMDSANQQKPKMQRKKRQKQRNLDLGQPRYSN